MKNFWIILLTVIVFVSGYIGTALFFIVDEQNWCKVVFFALMHLVTVPAAFWWWDYFNRIFNK